MSPPLWGFDPLSFLDNVWSVAKNKAEIAGKVIAKQLLERGTNRTLSLVGMSVGCQVILSILDTLPQNSFIVQDGTSCGGVECSDLDGMSILYYRVKVVSLATESVWTIRCDLFKA